MEAITVRPSLDKFLNVVITKNAEALHHQAHKPHVLNPHEQTNKQTNKQPQERRAKLLQASSSSSSHFLLPEHYYCFLDLLLLSEALVPVEAAGGFVQEKHAKTSENLKGNAHSSLFAPTEMFCCSSLFQTKQTKKTKKNVSILPFRGRVGPTPTLAGPAPAPVSGALVME